MYEKYWTEKCLPQVKELIDGYSPDLFWFDSWGDRTESQLTKSRLDRLVDLIRTHSPKTLINSRIGPSERYDFQSTDDNAFPNKKLDHLWETSGTMNHSWGYNKFDFDYRSTKFLLRALIDNISRNGNFQLNIGPRADGSLPPAVLRRLRELAAWTSINADAIFGTRPVDTDEPEWGRIVKKGNKIFLHVYEPPADGKLVLPGNLPTFLSATVLETEEKLAVQESPRGIILPSPKSLSDNLVTVVVLNA
jgi:alpha-L-fucosidase